MSIVHRRAAGVRVVRDGEAVVEGGHVGADDEPGDVERALGSVIRPDDLNPWIIGLGGAYLPSDRVEVSSKIGAATPVGKCNLMLTEVHGRRPGQRGQQDAIFRGGTLIERPGQAAA